MIGNMQSHYRTQLNRHEIPVLNELHPRQAAVKVHNFHFYVLRSAVFKSRSSAVFMNNDQDPRWIEDDDVSFYGMKKAIELALQSLYILDITIGECIVQRMHDNRFAVASVSERSMNDLNDSENMKIEHLLKNSNNHPQTFGTDIELLAQHKQTKKWIPASTILKRNHSQGWDDFIVIKNKTTIHPVIELRPNPSSSVDELYENICYSYEKMEQLLLNYQLQAIGGSNPYSRFFLGGHLHVGNQFTSFQLIKRLDAFLTIPFAVLYDDGVLERRRSHGRLGSVRENKYNGYEYRALPSWYLLIPTFPPVLQWFVYLQMNAEKISIPDLPADVIEAYYNDDKHRLGSYLEDCKQVLRYSMNQQDYTKFAQPFFQWLDENRVNQIDVGSKSPML